jgi:hypothetical protein
VRYRDKVYRIKSICYLISGLNESHSKVERQQASQRTQMNAKDTCVYLDPKLVFTTIEWDLFCRVLETVSVPKA